MDNPKMLDIAVSYGGSDTKQALPLNTELGAVSMLVINFEVLLKHCGMCERRKRLLRRNSGEFVKWYRDHEPNCD